MYAKTLYFFCFLVSLSAVSMAQQKELMDNLINNYEQYREKSLQERRINYRDIQPLIEKWRLHPDFEVKQVGTSIEGRPLNLISLGSGDTDVFLWSQMHGDESTATMAVFDILNFFASDDMMEEKQNLLSKVRLHFLPMLNPDGAQNFERRNSLGIDVNRDALRLQSPEGRTLKKVRDSLDADFGFNLHDQSRYYNAEGASNPATISFLAPAFNEEKDVNEVRARAMKLIVEMNQHLQEQIPGNVGRYNDDFEPRAFGDNIQKWGTSTVLIESGGYPEDPEKQYIRKLNFSAILAALFAIGNESYQTQALDDYYKIPQNDSKLYDLKLVGLTYELRNQDYILDLGINYAEAPSGEAAKMNYRGRIVDQGDLSTNFGYETQELSGYKLKPGKVYPIVLENIKALDSLDLKKQLSEGIIFYRVKNLPKGRSYYPFPLVIVGEKYKASGQLAPGITPNFLLYKEGAPQKAVVNGFIYELKAPDLKEGNGIILK